MRRTPLGTSAQWPVNRRKLRTVVARRPDRKNALQIRINGPAEVAVPGRLDRASHARGRRFETRRAHLTETLLRQGFCVLGRFGVRRPGRAMETIWKLRGRALCRFRWSTCGRQGLPCLLDRLISGGGRWGQEERVSAER